MIEREGPFGLMSEVWPVPVVVALLELLTCWVWCFLLGAGPIFLLFGTKPEIEKLTFQLNGLLAGILFLTFLSVIKGILEMKFTVRYTLWQFAPGLLTFLLGLLWWDFWGK
ncbi:MAG TPA: hypothetical protein VEA59_01260 [Patescibacteria group bacterium]|nr:hypothetical protein [Patescibacteria group bacterium]